MGLMGWARTSIDLGPDCVNKNPFHFSDLLHPSVTNPVSCLCVVMLLAVVSAQPVAVAPPVSLLWMNLGESSSSRSESHYEPLRRSGTCAERGLLPTLPHPFFHQSHVCLGYLR